MAEKAKWDPIVADETANAFSVEYAKLPKTVQKTLGELWKSSYLKCGHKRLGRVIVAALKDIGK